MYEKFCDLKIRTRLFLMISIAVTGFLITASVILLRDITTANNAKNFRELANIAPTVGQLIHELQIERGASTLYLSEALLETSSNILLEQKNNTDLAFKKFAARYSQNGYKPNSKFQKILNSASLELNKLDNIRQKITSQSMTTRQVAAYYADTIRKLLAIISEMEIYSANKQIAKHLIAYESYIEAKERAGQERAIGSIIFNSDATAPEVINKFLALIAQQESYLQIFTKNAAPESIGYADLTVSGPELKEYSRLRDLAIHSIITGSTMNLAAPYWFKVITAKIDQMKQVEDYLVKDLVAQAQDAENDANARFFTILFACIATTLLVIGGAYLIYRSIINPLGDITKSMLLISAGDLEQKVPHKGMHNSIGEIARVLCFFRLEVKKNIILEKKAQQQKLKEEERKRLISEIEKSELARTELEILKDKAESANRAKNEFLATMSHELRTPLNAIIGFSDVMRLKMLGNYKIDRYREYAVDINNSAIHLLEIINDILDLSNIETHKIDLATDEVSIEEIIFPVMSELNQRIKEKGLNLRLNTGHLESILIRVDQKRFKKIIRNLLSNAIKFTHSGGDIEIRASACEKKGLSLVIRDTGIGMNPSDIPKALSPFSQLDSSFSRQYDGTGVGLPLAKKLIELHDGTFRLTSQIGIGTTAIIQLPPSRLLLNKSQQIVNG